MLKCLLKEGMKGWRDEGNKWGRGWREERADEGGDVWTKGRNHGEGAEKPIVNRRLVLLNEEHSSN